MGVLHRVGDGYHAAVPTASLAGSGGSGALSSAGSAGAVLARPVAVLVGRDSRGGLAACDAFPMTHRHSFPKYLFQIRQIGNLTPSLVLFRTPCAWLRFGYLSYQSGSSVISPSIGPSTSPEKSSTNTGGGGYDGVPFAPVNSCDLRFFQTLGWRLVNHSSIAPVSGG